MQYRPEFARLRLRSSAPPLPPLSASRAPGERWPSFRLHTAARRRLGRTFDSLYLYFALCPCLLFPRKTHSPASGSPPASCAYRPHCHGPSLERARVR